MVLVIQFDKSIIFYRQKLTGPQNRYTVTEKESLSVAETLK